MDGYQTLWNKLSTVWSAPNYCYRCGNIASICEVDEQLNRFFNTFSAAPGMGFMNEIGPANVVP